MIGNVNVPGASNSDIVSINNSLANKVDKVSGKILTSNDFTNAYKSKLDNIDTTVTQNSSNLITSGAVATALSNSSTPDLGFRFLLPANTLVDGKAECFFSYYNYAGGSGTSMTITSNHLIQTTHIGKAFTPISSASSLMFYVRRDLFPSDLDNTACVRLIMYFYSGAYSSNNTNFMMSADDSRFATINGIEYVCSNSLSVLNTITSNNMGMYTILLLV